MEKGFASPSCLTNFSRSPPQAFIGRSKQAENSSKNRPQHQKHDNHHRDQNSENQNHSSEHHAQSDPERHPASVQATHLALPISPNHTTTPHFGFDILFWPGIDRDPINFYDFHFHYFTFGLHDEHVNIRKPKSRRAKVRKCRNRQLCLRFLGLEFEFFASR